MLTPIMGPELAAALSCHGSNGGVDARLRMPEQRTESFRPERGVVLLKRVEVVRDVDAFQRVDHGLDDRVSQHPHIGGKHLVVIFLRQFRPGAPQFPPGQKTPPLIHAETVPEVGPHGKIIFVDFPCLNFPILKPGVSIGELAHVFANGPGIETGKTRQFPQVLVRHEMELPHETQFTGQTRAGIGEYVPYGNRLVIRPEETCHHLFPPAHIAVSVLCGLVAPVSRSFR